MTHSINLTHDGTLILRIPKGYKVDKVVVEEMGTDNRKEYQPTHPTPSNTLGALDCVDRQAAIDAIERTKTAKSKDGELYVAKINAEMNIQMLPSAQPRKGKWIRTRTLMHDGELYCDQCDQEHPEQKKIWNFCPNCGADMRGDSDDSSRKD